MKRSKGISPVSKWFLPLIAIGLFLCSFNKDVKSQDNWTLVKSKDNIQVYLKDAPGWSLKAYWAKAKIKVSYSKALEYMFKYETRKDWIKDCTQSDVLSVSGDGERVMYFVIDAPWPTSDRDMVLKLFTDSTSEKNVVYFHFQGLAHYMPEKEERVRVDRAIGFWKIEKIDDEFIEISTQGKSETGGSIPQWMANMFVEDNPYDSLKNLREILEAL